MVMVVYDVTNPDTFHLLRQWLDSIKQQNGGKSLPGVVIANKIDLENRIAVTPHDGQAFAQSIGFEFIEVSAQRNHQIDLPFKTLANHYYQMYEDRMAQVSNL